LYRVDTSTASDVERLLETVERFEEDTTDTARIHRPLHCRIESAKRCRSRPNAPAAKPIRSHPARRLLEENAGRLHHLCHPWKD